METAMLLSEAWEQEAAKWIEWARKPGHDSYWQFHRDQFFELVPAPGKLTIDIGCGEGRLTRHLKELGHNVRGFDVSKTMIAAARQADPEGTYEIAGAGNLPLPDGCADLAVSFMVLQDVDDLSASINELSRVLDKSARACIAIVHPINSAGTFATSTEDSEFIIKGTYLGEHRNCDKFERDGLEMTFHSMHRPLDHYSRAFERAGLLIEAIREHPVPDGVYANSETSRRWKRVPMFMHFRVVKNPI
jgi:ubiquinone/menaquinone biosynthesis C-methylase UbiE